MKKELSIYEELFSKLGLNQSQSKIYEYLIKNGEDAAGNISKMTQIKRGLTYNALDELQRKGLLYKNIKLKVIKFGAEHPEKLRDFIENKEKEVRDIKNGLESILPTIVADFNITSDKPGVRYFEGHLGAQKAFAILLENKSNNPNEEILNFFDFNSFDGDSKLIKIGELFSKRRKELVIPQRMIVTESEKFNNYAKTKEKKLILIRTIKNTNSHIYSFNSDISIYNKKIVLISRKKDTNKTPTAIVIDNNEIFKTFQSLFFMIWDSAK